MATIKLTKNELKSQKDALKMYKRYLPTLLLKYIVSSNQCACKTLLFVVVHQIFEYVNLLLIEGFYGRSITRAD